MLRFTHTAAALALAAVLAGCGRGNADQAPMGAQPPAPEVQVQKVEALSLPYYLEFVGSTRAIDTVEIRARVEGFIEQRLFEAGETVKPNQLLYRIDPRTYEADLKEARAALNDAAAQLVKAREGVELLRAEAELVEAQAQLARARQDIARIRPLAAEEAVSAQVLDSAEAAEKVAAAQVKAKQAEADQERLTQRTDIERAAAAVERSEAVLRRAELNLEWTSIRAPVGGRIGESLGQVGSLVTPGSPEPLTELSPLNPISVSFQVSERDYLEHFDGGTVAKGAAFSLVLANGEEFPHEGKFRSAERALDTKTGTLQLTADFPNPEGTLLPGQFARVRWRAGQRDGVFLAPQKAVQQLQGMRSVLLVDADNTVVARTVTVSEQQGENWVVREGLKDGDRIIVDGLQFLQPGMKVIPVEATPAAPNAD